MAILKYVKVLGVVFLALAVGAVWLTYAVFTKKFTDYQEVSLETSSIGLQLPNRADVKIRGVIVGEVLDAETTASGATLTLGIFPDEIDTIPADVTGSIVPKTLFGEKYVSLVVPQDPARDHIEAGATIDRTVVSTEVEQVLSDLYPLLRTVQPAELNMTLNALATALEGRGEDLGETIETLDAYLKRFNPQVPALVEDLRLTAEVSDIYADVLPEVGQILRNTITTTSTLEDREERLQAVFTDVTAFSDTTRGFLETNGDNLIRLADLSVPQVGLLAKYAPEFPCLLGGVVNAGSRQAEAFRDYTLHIVLETIPNQPRKYTAADAPRFGESRGPSCLNLPNPPWDQDNPLRSVPNFDDGVDEPTGKGTSRVAPSYWLRSGDGYAGSAAETDLINSLLAPGMGVAADDVPDLGGLLVGPLARGAEVELR
ncbi:MAG: MCE family protein [Nocardioides sp.]|nr:MCE family protein [Nocardioides sp.]